MLKRPKLPPSPSARITRVLRGGLIARAPRLDALDQVGPSVEIAAGYSGFIAVLPVVSRGEGPFSVSPSL